jgi:hypothetical protein
MIVANRVFSVAAVVLGASAVMSSFAVTPAAAWTHHRHVRVYRNAPAHYVTVHPVYRYGYPVAVYNYNPVAVGVDAAGAMAVSIVGAAAGLAGGILGSPYAYYPGYVYRPAW